VVVNGEHAQRRGMNRSMAFCPRPSKRISKMGLHSTSPKFGFSSTARARVPKALNLLRDI
jgi:hypothetical protein